MAKNQINRKTYLENIGKVSNEENEKRLADYQAATDHKYKKLDYVKSKFKVNEEGCFEHMWIFVLSVDEELRTVTGSLSNNPLHNNSLLKYGQVLTVSFDDIESIIPHTHKSSRN